MGLRCGRQDFDLSCSIWTLRWGPLRSSSLTGIEPAALGARGLSRWTIRDVLHRNSLNQFYPSSSFQLFTLRYFIDFPYPSLLISLVAPRA